MVHGGDGRFDGVDRRIDRLDDKVEAGFAQMAAKFDALQLTILQVGGGLIVGLIVTLISLAIART